MIIAVTTAADSLDGLMDRRFGRAPRFIIYNLETQEFSVKDNSQNLNAAQGAGIQSAQNVIESGAGVVITGHCGPKAFRALSAAGITVYNCGADTVREALNLFEIGALLPSLQADVEGHWA